MLFPDLPSLVSPRIKRRLLARRVVDPSSGCWLSSYCGDGAGYAHFRVDGRMVCAHRLSFAAFVGSIPAGKLVLHRCDVRKCFNPEHLFLGSHADNAADAVRKGRLFRAVGEANGSAKLSADQVRELRASSLSAVELAKRFGVSDTSVRQARRGLTWKHVV